MPIKRYAALNSKARLVLAMGLLLTCASTYAVTEPAVVDPAAQTLIAPIAPVDPLVPLESPPVDPTAIGVMAPPPEAFAPPPPPPMDVPLAELPVDIDPALMPPPIDVPPAILPAP
ncbi:hypothetical protein OYT1_ch2455 [Ferriphaselus amnicola]|uniref:Uncharacterized protein n=1 Tax=Ferriphaselus amnicola TaxID=1188319 RepID=A0A2Z6GEI0_9PROT|nr:hypothetical protein [Ferriphaselus amnicola]BBE51968.1 hypothetical protein OYT1_ch2455 [Ferriphaselus amnicola]